MFKFEGVSMLPGYRNSVDVSIGIHGPQKCWHVVPQWMILHGTIAGGKLLQWILFL